MGFIFLVFSLLQMLATTNVVVSKAIVVSVVSENTSDLL